MGFKIIRCPNCRWSYRQDLDRTGVGQPFYNCPQCKYLTLDDDRTEWELMDFGQRLGLFLIIVMRSIVFGPIIFILLLGFLAWLFSFEESFKGLTVFLTIGILGFVAMGTLNVWLEIREIRESKQRMRGVQYRNQLKELGILKD